MKRKPAETSGLRLPALFQDHMVLQRSQPVRVWGWERPGRTVSVTLARARASARADRAGRWEIRFAPLPVGGPYTLHVEGSRKITVVDVLVGEVWLASGQSNMAFPFSGSHDVMFETPRADLPGIRFFSVGLGEAERPIEDVRGRWEVCSPVTVQNCSAVGYYFAKRIHAALNIPVGLIVSAWSGTQIESWAPAKSMRQAGSLKGVFSRWRATPAGQRIVLDGPTEFDIRLKDVRLLPAEPGQEPALLVPPGSRLNGARDIKRVWRSSVESADIDWEGKSRREVRFRGRIMPGEWAWAERSLRPDWSPARLDGYSALEFSARGKGALAVALEQPSVRDWDRFSSGVFPLGENWARGRVPFAQLRQEGWGIRKRLTLDEISSIMFMNVPARSGPGLPGGLFNSMIAPLARYGIRGVLWYQGEGNAGRASEYRALLGAMMGGWRRAFGKPKLPFLIVQLPNYGTGQGESWAALREAQLKAALELPGVGLAVTIDLGEPGNLHPANKRDIGTRLVLCALGIVYGFPMVYCGPVYRDMVVENGGVRLKFAHTGGGLAARWGTLCGFKLAGPDRKFIPAEARIEGHTVKVRNPRIARPVAVRYAWADSPQCNLCNREGLPASPFRTDSWPLGV